MIKVEIKQIENYKVTQDYELIEETEHPTSYRLENNFRYTFEIQIGTYADEGYRNKDYKSLMIYSEAGYHGNFLVSGNHSYEFNTMNLFNSNSNTYLSYKIQVCKSLNGKDHKFHYYDFNNETIVMLLKEFDSLKSTNDYNTFSSLNETTSKLKEENIQLRKLIKDLKRRINESIKGLRK